MTCCDSSVSVTANLDSEKTEYALAMAGGSGAYFRQANP